MAIELLNIDCMEYMAGLEDNAFDLAVVDPPYGIGNWIPQHGKQKGRNAEKLKVDWNEEGPQEKYFVQLARVSVNQIIWGANYYNCFPKLGGAIVWDKNTGNPKFSRCEIASHSFYKKVDYYFFDWNAGFHREKYGAQIHPCQKPVQLYEWLLSNFAEPGQRILDTHLGSGSSAIAAHYGGFDFVGCEIDEDYYKAACERFDQETRQEAMF